MFTAKALRREVPNIVSATLRLSGEEKFCEN
jgi:hypothetical protein